MDICKNGFDHCDKFDNSLSVLPAERMDNDNNLSHMKENDNLFSTPRKNKRKSSEPKKRSSDLKCVKKIRSVNSSPNNEINEDKSYQISPDSPDLQRKSPEAIVSDFLCIYNRKKPLDNMFESNMEITTSQLTKPRSVSSSIPSPASDHHQELYKDFCENNCSNETMKIYNNVWESKPVNKKEGKANLCSHEDVFNLSPHTSYNVELSYSKKGRKNYKNMTRERRVEANARERSRVHTISAAFENLRHAVPSYSHNQRLSKLAILRIACTYIMSLASIVGYNYTWNTHPPCFADCVEECTKTIQTEGKAKRKH